MYSVYILQNTLTSRYYIGFTKNLSERLHRHNTKRNISTNRGGQWKIVYSESVSGRQAAWLRERAIKRMKGGNGFKKLLLERWPSG